MTDFHPVAIVLIVVILLAICVGIYFHLNDKNRDGLRPECNLPPWAAKFYTTVPTIVTEYEPDIETNATKQTEVQSISRLRLREWARDQKWRKENGWHGRDLIHNPDSKVKPDDTR